MTGIIFKTKLIFRTEFIFAKSNASVKYMHQSKYLRKEGRRISNFSQELQKDKSFLMLSPAIHLKGWG